MRSNDDEVMTMMTHCCLTLEVKHTPDQMASTEMPISKQGKNNYYINIAKGEKER
jgi:hypothetical protein